MRKVQSTLFALLAASSSAVADTTLNLTQGVSSISHDVYDLHMTIFWICVAIGVLVFSVMIYSMVHHRKSLGVKPAEFHSHPVLEIAWTIVPIIILMLMAVPASKVLFNMNNQDDSELTIKITGYQWKWHYDYLEDGVQFFSNLTTPQDQMQNKAPKGEHYLREVDNALVIPIHKKVRLLITSNDVNHAWWVPDLAVKRDAVAGFINEAWTVIDKPGTYRGQCAELCGINHAFMPIVVIAVTEQGYKDWVAKQKGEATQGDVDTNRPWTKEELMANGEKTYNKICSACHQPTGLGLPPTFPALKGSKIATGPIEGHIEIVFNGKSGTAMQAFRTQLSDTELASVITYERNAWGNNANSIVQPIQIKALRDGKSLVDALKVTPSAEVAKPKQGADAVTPATPMTTAPAQAPHVVPENSAPNAATLPPDSSENKPINAPQSIEPGPLATNNPDVVINPKLATTVTNEQSVKVSASTLQEAIVRGEKVYQSTCAVCHQVSGLGLPPTFPALKGSKIATGPIDEHIHQVLFGKPGTAMQAFKDQLNDQQIADVVTYERNAWDNNTNTLATPEAIAKLRQTSAAAPK